MKNKYFLYYWAAVILLTWGAFEIAHTDDRPACRHSQRLGGMAIREGAFGVVSIG